MCIRDSQPPLGPSEGDGLLFTAPDGGVLRYSNWPKRAWYPAAVGARLGRMVDEASGKTKYQGIGFHDLRRANATGLVAAGVDVKTAQTLLGHSDSRLTLDHYAQAVTALGVAAAESRPRPHPRSHRGHRGGASRPGSNRCRRGDRPERPDVALGACCCQMASQVPSGIRT